MPAIRESELMIFGNGIGVRNIGFTGTGGKLGLRIGSGPVIGELGLNVGENTFCGVAS